MPDYQEHYQKYKHNELFVEYVRNSEFIDWYIVGIFYSTLHMVHYYLHRLDIDISEKDIDSHGKTIRVLSTYNTTTSNLYGLLFRYSKLARYNFYSVSDEDITDTLSLQAEIKNCMSKYLANVIK